MAVALARCSVCDEGIVVKLLHNEDACRWIYNENPDHSPIVLDFWPKPNKLECPPGAPENISSFFLQAAEALGCGCYDAAATMFGKCLDAALMRISPNARGSLRQRIDALGPETGVTPNLKQLAHAIRELRNEAVHEEMPIGEGEARRIAQFTHLFLTMAFALPLILRGLLTEEVAK